ncbi:6-phosphogluconolactonase [Halosimplex carlsbadense 2-9-1]|uniref:6-phosphogluconolactonase n=1 Tax=Halosimplex carlsbadense 2-9-1 TaxID=797114 RepID=M0CCD7_9EURY|nr:lactonase family protein [Halosimplex carlsbadense]ELZ19997.1 6-phosphogluconolactonase [Halosimplex carlsbadense 2-9-1]
MTDADHLALVCSTAGDGESGVYAYDADAGTLSETATTSVEHPMYLAVHPQGDRVYVANRTDGGTVSAFAVDRSDGSLERLADRSSEGAGPCYVSVDPVGRYAFVANYGGGTAAMYPLDGAGDLGPACDVVRHEGSGPNADRQADPHPHSAVPGPDGRSLYVPDLGTDEVARYRIDADEDRLRPADPPGVTLPPGTGPRHLAFGPDGEYGYLAGELDSTVTVLARDAATGALERVASASTLPEAAEGTENAPADVHVHPDGPVYVSNRGHRSVTAFAAFDDARGGLRSLGHTPTGGANPRDFAVAPDGRHLLVENRDGYDVATFSVDADGRLTERARRAVPKPTCLAFVPRA